MRDAEKVDVYIIPNPFDHSIILGNMIRKLGDIRCGDMTLFDDAQSVEELMIEMLIGNIVLEMNGPKEPKTDHELLDELISYTVDSKRGLATWEPEKEVEDAVQDLIFGMGTRLKRSLKRMSFDPRPNKIHIRPDAIHISMTEVCIDFVKKDIYVRLEPVLYRTTLPNPSECTEQEFELIVKSDDFTRCLIEDTQGVDEGYLDANSFYPHSRPEALIDHYQELVVDFKRGYNDPRSLFFSDGLYMLANSEQMGCSCGLNSEDCVGSLIRYIAWELSSIVE